MEDIRSIVSKYVKPSFEYEIYLETSKKESIEVSDEKLENLSKSTDTGLGIRVLWDNRVGFAYTTNLKEESIKNCVEKAMEICQLTPQDDGFSFYCQKPKEESLPYEPLDLPIQDKIDLVVSLEKKAKHLDDRIKGVRKTSLEEKEVEVYCYNSCGLEYHYRTTFYTSSISALAEDKGDASISYDFRGARKFKDLDLDGMVQEVVFKAVSLLNPKPYETKVM
ncbi:MAG: TldD/PmbA family protein, partial [Hydrogenobacter sp.]